MAAEIAIDIGQTTKLHTTYVSTADPLGRDSILLTLETRDGTTLQLDIPRRYAEAFGAEVQDRLEACCREHPLPKRGVYRAGSNVPEPAGFLASLKVLGVVQAGEE